MKLRYVLAGIIAFVAFSCNDDENEIGFTLQPTGDQIDVKSHVFDISSQTVFLDSMFIKTDTAFLGQYTTPELGTTKADFMAQVNCTKDFAWSSDIKTIDSVILKLYYKGFFGDSLAPMNVTVYELNNKQSNQKKNYYTNTNVADFCDMKNLLGQKTVVAADILVSDSLKSTTNYDGPYISIRLDNKLINRFFNNYNAANFASTEAFTNFFKGLYVTTNFGDGTILFIDDIYMQFCYTQPYSSTSDSMVMRAATFATSKEVVLNNRVKHTNLKEKYSAADSVTLIKSPIGAITKVAIPIKAIRDSTGNNELNTVELTLTADNPSSEKYMSYVPPYKLLLLKESELIPFFENEQLYDSESSYVATYSSANQTYTFKNIAKLLSNSDKDVQEMYLVPVTVNFNSSASLATNVKPMFTPAAVRLKKSTCANRPLRLNLIYSKF